MSRLIVVSNRVMPPSPPGAGSTGGLAMALSAALREYSGIWFGWSGQTTDSFTGQIAVQRVDGVTIATVDLEEQDRQEYYNGYANVTLWPLFHYRVDLTAYERSFDEGYMRVNARFAETLAPLIAPEDFVWVQDYHLIPLARELRRLGVKNRIGFFLHIPWPGRRTLTTLPNHDRLVESMFAYDLVGFQSEDSLRAFEEYVVYELDGNADRDHRVTAFGRSLQLGAFPIGLDTGDFVQAAKDQRAETLFRRVRDSMAGRKMIVGVDRLDYSKGLEERFLAYEQFLIDNPAELEKVFLLQIATPTREEVEAYQDIRNRLDAVSGRINGAFATVDWVPLRYVNRAYRRDELAGVYRAAHIGLITPLRDGMNLVAKEYVASQDPSDPGVLILSKMAGAAEQLKDALLVNPLSREDVSEAIKRGLAMPKKERIRRWEALWSNIEENDVTAWRDAFVRALHQAGGRRIELIPA